MQLNKTTKMRTKALILGAAFVAAGVASTMAQSNVYSLNIVGYVNVAVPAGFSILSNPLDDGLGDGNAIGSVLSNTNTPATTQVFLYSPSGGFGNPETYFAGFGWLPGTDSLPPGTGFFYFSPSATNVTFVGQIAAGTYTNALAANSFNLVGSVVPESLPLGAPGIPNTLGIPASANDQVFRYNPALYSGGYDSITYFSGFGWIDSAVGLDPNNTNGPALNVGEGVFLFSGSGGNWVETFSVN
jgi:hypothetical protein